MSRHDAPTWEETTDRRHVFTILNYRGKQCTLYLPTVLPGVPDVYAPEKLTHIACMSPVSDRATALAWAERCLPQLWTFYLAALKRRRATMLEGLEALEAERHAEDGE